MAYDPPYDVAVIVGVRRAATFSCHDRVVVRFADGSRKSLWPHQITLAEDAL